MATHCFHSRYEGGAALLWSGWGKPDTFELVTGGDGRNGSTVTMSQDTSVDVAFWILEPTFVSNNKNATHKNSSMELAVI